MSEPKHGASVETGAVAHSADEATPPARPVLVEYDGTGVRVPLRHLGMHEVDEPDDGCVVVALIDDSIRVEVEEKTHMGKLSVGLLHRPHLAPTTINEWKERVFYHGEASSSPWMLHVSWGRRE